MVTAHSGAGKPARRSLGRLQVAFDDEHAVANAGLVLTGTLAQRTRSSPAGRVRRAEAAGPLTVRADSGFWSAKIIGALRHHRIRFSITVRQTGPIRVSWCWTGAMKHAPGALHQRPIGGFRVNTPSGASRAPGAWRPRDRPPLDHPARPVGFGS